MPSPSIGAHLPKLPQPQPSFSSQLLTITSIALGTLTLYSGISLIAIGALTNLIPHGVAIGSACLGLTGLIFIVNSIGRSLLNRESTKQPSAPEILKKEPIAEVQEKRTPKIATEDFDLNKIDVVHVAHIMDPLNTALDLIAEFPPVYDQEGHIEFSAFSSILKNEFETHQFSLKDPSQLPLDLSKVEETKQLINKIHFVFNVSSSDPTPIHQALDSLYAYLAKRYYELGEPLKALELVNFHTNVEVRDLFLAKIAQDAYLSEHSNAAISLISGIKDDALRTSLLTDLT